MSFSVMPSAWTIRPFLGVGPLSFGLGRDEVRTELRGRISTFLKGPFARIDTDAFEDSGVHAYFDQNDRLECIELIEPCQAEYKGVSTINRPIAEVLRDFAQRDISYREDDGYFFDQGGFVLFTDEGVVKAVTVYRPGYYDN